MFQISSMDQFLKVQEQLGAELQKQIKTLSEKEEEHKKMYEKKSEELKQLEERLKDLQSQAEEKEKRLREDEAQNLSLKKQNAELENVVQEMKKEAEVQYCFMYQNYLSRRNNTNVVDFYLSLSHNSVSSKPNPLNSLHIPVSYQDARTCSG